mgnify:CR=1 FL=1
MSHRFCRSALTLAFALLACSVSAQTPSAPAAAPNATTSEPAAAAPPQATAPASAAPASTATTQPAKTAEAELPPLDVEHSAKLLPAPPDCPQLADWAHTWRERFLGKMDEWVNHELPDVHPKSVLYPFSEIGRAHV